MLIDEGLRFLVEQAKLERVTSYTELNAVLARRTRVLEFDFSRQDERAAMGHLLGSIVDRNHPETGLMISALVTYLNSNDAGSGFYNLAVERGVLRRGASSQDRFDFWLGQVKALHQHYARMR